MTNASNVVECSPRNVCHMSFEGHGAVECYSQVSGNRCRPLPTRTLRSASSDSLEVKRTRIKAGGGSFAVAAASPLPNFFFKPVTLASFKCRLKAILFFVSHIRVYEHCPLLIAI